MRILVSVKPKMYREAISLALHIHRPHTEVMLTSPESLDGRVEDFSPHLFVRTDAEGVAPEAPERVACLIEILYSNGMGARIIMDGRRWEIADMSIEELLQIVDEVEGSIAEGKLEG